MILFELISTFLLGVLIGLQLAAAGLVAYGVYLMFRNLIKFNK